MPLDQAANEQRPVNRTYTNTVYKVASGSLVVHASGLLAVLFFRFFLAPIAAWCPDCGPEVRRGVRPFIAPPFRSPLLFAETVVANDALGPDKEKLNKGGDSSCVC